MVFNRAPSLVVTVVAIFFAPGFALAQSSTAMPPHALSGKVIKEGRAELVRQCYKK